MFSKMKSIQNKCFHFFYQSKETEMNSMNNQNGAPDIIVCEGTKPAGRLVNKDGSYYIEHVDPPNLFWKQFRNAFQLMLEMKWRWVWLALCILFPMTWTLFGLLFYVIAYYHGDFEEANRNNSDFIPCVGNIKGFLSLFLFSVESQETVGYGYRYENEECPLLLFLLCLQVVVGAVLQASLCAVIWARLLRPKRRGQEVIFSKNACMALNHDGELCLMFRISDIDGTHLVQSCVRLYVAIKTRITNAPNTFSFKLFHMHMGEENGRDKVLFLWPTVACHVINKKSPLYSYGKDELEKSDLEFIAVAEGIVESTGLTVQTRTSYLASEVLWGYKFQTMNFCDKLQKCTVKVQYKNFDSFYPVETPTYSMKERDAMKQVEHLEEVSKRKMSKAETRKDRRYSIHI